MEEQKIVMVICTACEKRGPDHIFFRVEFSPDQKTARMTVECAECGNKERVFENRDRIELEQMAAAGKQLDLSHLKRFTVC